MSEQLVPHSPIAASRRQVLLGGSSLLVGALLLKGESASVVTGLDLLAAQAGPKVPVAYLEGSNGAKSLADALASGATTAVPALGLSADASSRAGHLTVRGLADTSHAHAGFGTLLLDALVPSPVRRSELLPFAALTFREGSSVQGAGTGRLAVSAAARLPVGFRMQASSPSVHAATVVFSHRPSRHVPTLRPGIYLLGLRPGQFTAAQTLPPLGDRRWAALPSVVVAVGAA